MQRENILCMTDTIDVASFLADFYVLYKFASLEYVECAGIFWESAPWKGVKNFISYSALNDNKRSNYTYLQDLQYWPECW
jgi:hypothetical protein